jgi:hypothetical protein
LRDQLKAGLSGKTPALDTESGSSVSEMAERIKSLKASHNIDATPQRVRQKQSSAEEPVTARIPRRTEASTASKQAIQSDDAVSAAVVSSPQPESPTQDSSINSKMTFQERIAIERRRKEPEPNLS